MGSGGYVLSDRHQWGLGKSIVLGEGDMIRFWKWYVGKTEGALHIFWNPPLSSSAQLFDNIAQMKYEIYTKIDS